METSLNLNRTGTAYVASIDGDVDLASARSLSEQILAGFPSDADGLVVDLTGVRYLDSTGISMLLDLHRSVESRRQKMGVVLPRSSHLWRLFTITGIESILRIAESLEDATASVAQ